MPILPQYFHQAHPHGVLEEHPQGRWLCIDGHLGPGAASSEILLQVFSEQPGPVRARFNRYD